MAFDPAPVPICHLTLNRTPAFDDQNLCYDSATEHCIGSVCSAWDPSTTANLGKCGLNPAKDRRAWKDPA